MENHHLKSAIESLLFVSGEPMKSSRLAKICGVSKAEVENAAEELAKDYENGRGLRIIKKEDLLQMSTSPENAPLVSQLVSSESNSDLSSSALETLSIIAYRGPLSRAQIENIRGVNCTYVLRSLMVRGLIERKENADIRGYIYEVSFDFLKNLGITSAQDLPDWKILSENEKIETVLQTPDTPASGDVPSVI